mgnify:CR=1 FL=1
MALIVNPLGDFPLNDDWAYAQNVFQLAEKGTFYLSDWPAMTLIVHTLLGYLFAKVFGFSFIVLRLSVWLLGLVALVSFYQLIKQLNASKAIMFITAFCLALNPLFFLHSFSFMTEISFLAMFLLALRCYSRFFITCELKFIFWGSFFSLLATMIRQPGILLPVAFLIGYLVSGKWEQKPLLIMFVALIIITGALIGWPMILQHYDMLPGSYSSIQDLIAHVNRPGFLYSLFFRTSMLLIYFGIFLLPVSVLIFWTLWNQLNKTGRIVAISVSVIAVSAVVINISHFPAGNVFYNMGLGPKVLKDTYWNVNVRPVFPDSVLLLKYILGIAGAFLFAFNLMAVILKLGFKKPAGPLNRINLFIIALAAGYIVFLFSGKYFFDRYYLPLLPLVLILMITSARIRTRKFPLAISIAVLGLIAWFSIAATHDYFAWNRARWAGLNHLLKSGETPSNIDGGFEFNAWYDTGELNPLDRQGKSWWFVDNDSFAVTFGKWPGFETDTTILFFSYLTLKPDSIFILKKEPPVVAE